jgi:hypothetical protein
LHQGLLQSLAGFGLGDAGEGGSAAAASGAISVADFNISCQPAETVRQVLTDMAAMTLRRVLGPGIVSFLSMVEDSGCGYGLKRRRGPAAVCIVGFPDYFL